MADLHCHSCDWLQDDFWMWEWTWKIWKFRPFGYNPISLMIDDIREYIKPRYSILETWIARERGLKSNKIHAWRLLMWGWKRHFTVIFTMKWRTWESWKKHKDTAVCPGCGDRNFDID